MAKIGYVPPNSMKGWRCWLGYGAVNRSVTSGNTMRCEMFSSCHALFNPPAFRFGWLADGLEENLSFALSDGKVCFL
jgi:hypothetical protein